LPVVPMLVARAVGSVPPIATRAAAAPDWPPDFEKCPNGLEMYSYRSVKAQALPHNILDVRGPCSGRPSS
jgi:hypothetical protein